MELHEAIHIDHRMFYRFCKRSMDVVGAIAGMMLFSPLFFLIPILIKSDSPGPVIHRRKVWGRDGVSFYFYKFRTMIDDADEVMSQWEETNPKLYEDYVSKMKLDEDPRVTSVGEIMRRMSLDELPQFFNVLKGEMSLVGPRPIVEEEKDKYRSGELEKRFSVKPGITGYWQVNRADGIAYQGRVKMDLYYLDHQSLSLDLKIILKTIWVFFLTGRNR